MDCDRNLKTSLISLLDCSVKQKASDLHISPGQRPILRINGDLVPLQGFSILDANTTKKFIYDILSVEQQCVFESALEIDLSIVFSDLAAFRINAFHQLNGISAVFRMIPIEIPTLDAIASPEVLKELLNLSSGLILVTGPTGCGKSTTLAAMVDCINTYQQYHIITIEDPIEFIHRNKKSLVHQRQIYRDSTSFSAALRSALREDPDVILIGEMRDLETIRLALTAAETGHLVMATLHSSSAPRAINRIIDVFPPSEKNIIRNLVSESLQAVICQTLVKKTSGGRVAAFE
ncbi:MAG: PilT/PilU family type 4a pilus ATPase, partial [Gammaproteobacteria bacterium]|nr:PilT/PilU family type 4a pilus ATPase [Gammaproteobacteria bacterium]